MIILLIPPDKLQQVHKICYHNTEGNKVPVQFKYNWVRAICSTHIGLVEYITGRDMNKWQVEVWYTRKNVVLVYTQNKL